MTEVMIKSLRPTYAFINLDNLENNINVARKLSGTDLMAVVKADGYGHGALRTARHAYENCGVSNFGVATISEGLMLRSSFGSIDPRIIILGYVDRNFYREVIKANLTFTVFDYDAADCLHGYLESKNLTYPVALKLDSGMHRLGFDTDLDLDLFAARYPRFEIKHVMSHFSSSDSNEEFSAGQMKRFDNFVYKYAHYGFTTSLFNSSAIPKYKNKYTLTRPGLFLYGYVHGTEVSGLKPVMSIHSKVIHTKKLPKGEATSYDRTYVADKDMVIGIVPIGYADGYRLSLSNRGYMFVDGVRCRVLGRVCMDMTVVDLSDVKANAYGKEVEVMGSNITATGLAGLAGTMEYEFLTGISDRIPRIYGYSEVK